MFSLEQQGPFWAIKKDSYNVVVAKEGVAKAIFSLKEDGKYVGTDLQSQCIFVDKTLLNS